MSKALFHLNSSLEHEWLLSSLVLWFTLQTSSCWDCQALLHCWEPSEGLGNWQRRVRCVSSWGSRRGRGQSGPLVTEQVWWTNHSAREFIFILTLTPYNIPLMCVLWHLFDVGANRGSGRTNNLPTLLQVERGRSGIWVLKPLSPSPSQWTDHFCPVSSNPPLVIQLPNLSSSVNILTSTCKVLALLFHCIFCNPTYPFWYHVGSGISPEITE